MYSPDGVVAIDFEHFWEIFKKVSHAMSYVVSERHWDTRHRPDMGHRPNMENTVCP